MSSSSSASRLVTSCRHEAFCRRSLTKLRILLRCMDEAEASCAGSCICCIIHARNPPSGRCICLPTFLPSPHPHKPSTGHPSCQTLQQNHCYPHTTCFTPIVTHGLPQSAASTEPPLPTHCCVPLCLRLIQFIQGQFTGLANSYKGIVFQERISTVTFCIPCASLRGGRGVYKYDMFFMHGSPRCCLSRDNRRAPYSSLCRRMGIDRREMSTGY